MKREATKRQLIVAELRSEGLTFKEIGMILNITVPAVRLHYIRFLRNQQVIHM